MRQPILCYATRTPEPVLVRDSVWTVEHYGPPAAAHCPASAHRLQLADLHRAPAVAVQPRELFSLGAGRPCQPPQCSVEPAVPCVRASVQYAARRPGGQIRHVSVQSVK